MRLHPAAATGVDAARSCSRRPFSCALEALGIEVRSPARLRGSEEQSAFAALNADVAIVAAYGLILPQPVLDAPRSMAASMSTPRCCPAGAALHRSTARSSPAMTTTGVTIMQMEAGLDTGPMLAMGRAANRRAATPCNSLSNSRKARCNELLVDSAWRTSLRYPPRKLRPTNRVSTYAAKIDKAESRLDFHATGREQVVRQIRAFALRTRRLVRTLQGERIRILDAVEKPMSGQLTGSGVSIGGTLAIACA